MQEYVGQQQSVVEVTGGFFQAANEGYTTGNATSSQYGVESWSYNTKGSVVKYGVYGGVWNNDGSVPGNQYGVCGAISFHTPKGNIQSYGVYCMGNGAEAAVDPSCGSKTKDEYSTIRQCIGPENKTIKCN